jgi:enamine deaminase RidA (YjgF/YER057c/UK114 family)
MLQYIETGKRMSQAVVANGFVFLAGQVAPDPKQDVASQTAQVLAEIDRLLALSRSDKRHLVSATIYLTDMADFATMNSVWEPWVDPRHKPARATVQAQLAAPEYRVEISIIAVQRIA